MQNSIVVITPCTVYISLVFIVVSVAVIFIEVFGSLMKMNKVNGRSQKCLKKAPGPRPLPIIGNLASLDGYEVPYQAFSDLGQKYGPVVSLQLGNIPTLVVNGIEHIREVLIMKTAHFDNRPNFRRYHQLFSGNKENSLAFCDWSELHKLRRDMLNPHTFPRNMSNRFQELNNIIKSEMDLLLQNLSFQKSNEIHVKDYFLKSCANIFTEYFCSKRLTEDDKSLDKLVKNFDKIFYEVNQGYAADFLPFLMPFHKKNLKQMKIWSHEIRDIIVEKIIEDRFVTTNTENDLVDSFILYIKNNPDTELNMDVALYALEDIIGGHSAVGNFLMRVFAYTILNPEVQKKIQDEVDNLSINDADVIDLENRIKMPYTQAVVMESLRLIASPIVPHVSNQPTTVNGYDVEENTLVFLNNYELNMSPDLWEDPKTFKPERFLKDNVLVKPDFFLPFGAGRRSCMGYKLVQFITFAVLSNVLKRYNIIPLPTENYTMQPGSLAVPEKSFQIKLEQRYPIF